MFCTISQARLRLIEHYTAKGCQASVVTRPLKTKRLHQLAPMLIVSSKQDGTHSGAVSDCARHCLFFKPIRPQMSPHLPRSNDTTSLWDKNWAPTPACMCIKNGSGIKACRAFICKETCWRGAPLLAESLQLSGSYSQLPRPWVRRWHELQTLSQGKLFCCTRYTVTRQD